MNQKNLGRLFIYLFIFPLFSFIFIYFDYLFIDLLIHKFINWWIH